jgi:hypothetical protein
LPTVSVQDEPDRQGYFLLCLGCSSFEALSVCGKEHACVRCMAGCNEIP